MASLEQSLGVQATYYFRTTSNVFRPEVIRRVKSQGHEIGYHYETLAACQGDYEQARHRFEMELAQFRVITPVETIAMHGSPLSRYDNRALWNRYDYKQYDLLGEAYLDIDYTQIGYITDAGRSWAAKQTNLRDRPLEKNILQLPAVHTTVQLIELIQSKKYPRLIIQAHPERWAYSRLTWVRSFGMDLVANGVKRLLSMRSSRR